MASRPNPRLDDISTAIGGLTVHVANINEALGEIRKDLAEVKKFQSKTKGVIATVSFILMAMGALGAIAVEWLKATYFPGK